MGSPRRLFVGLYAASGAAALVYEVTWTRLLTLQLGHTVAAASTVLAAFMGGLAIGAHLASFVRHREHPARYLRTYASLELLVAATAIALPFALRASVPMLAWAYADGAAPARFAIVRVAISLALLGVPAAAMGATFPIATNWYARTAADTGALYAANTAGAALGAIAAGFFLIPALGLRATTWVGVALNVGAASGAWLIAQQTEPAERAEVAENIPHKRKKGSPRPQQSPRVDVVAPSPAPMLAGGAAALSGFAALVYEVAWTRLLALVLGPTTYAFATMAAAFIGGLAIGSAVGTRIARRVESPGVWLAAMLAVSSLGAAVAAYLAATEMPLVVAAQVVDPNVSFTPLLLRQAVTVGVLLLPMTLALGATFPLALAVASEGAASVGIDAARVYAANTVGAILGALVAGFALVPRLGLEATFRSAAILGVLGSAACFSLVAASRTSRVAGRQSPSPQPPAPSSRPPFPSPRAIGLAASVAIAAVAAIVMLPAWDHQLLASGAYKYAPYLGSDNLDTVLRAGELLYYKEGAAATVSVRKLTGTTSLAIDGKVDASNAGDMLTQRLLGLLPVLLHGRAEDVAVIGLGSGVTVGSALAAGTVRRADVIEISPEVVAASRFFDRESGAPLARPDVRLIVGDGRTHLLLTPQRYDVIISEPSNPWMAGVAALFTREFFEAAHARLKDGGLLCQWAHTYDISREDLQSIVRTFASVFPEGTMWMVGGGDLLLIGPHDGTVRSRLAAIERGAQHGAAAAALADVGLPEGTAPFAILSQYVGGPRELARFGDDARVQTDDRMALEYSAPRGIYGRSREDNAAAIRALGAEPPAAIRDIFARATDADWAARGQMEMRAQAFPAAYDSFLHAATLNARNAAALSGLSDAAGGIGKLGDVRDWLKAAAARDRTNAALRIELSRVLAVAGDANGAAEAAGDALQLAPDDPRAAEQLASVFADTGDGQRLAPLAEAMVARFPGRTEPAYYRATALYLRGQHRDAIAAARRVIDTAPGHARAYGVLGAACAAAGDRECARSAFEAAVRINPRDPAAYVNAGVFNLQAANAAAAESFFASALTIDPTSKPARDGLNQAHALLANPR